MEQKKKIKIIIIVLAVLLGVSLSALGATLVHNKIASNTPATVTVPDNLITPDEDTSDPDSSDSAGRAPDSGGAEQPDGSDTQTPSRTVNGTSSVVSAQSTTAGTRRAAAIALYNRQPEENTPFQVGNMFPGDSVTKYFRVQVSYSGTVTVHYKATVRPRYEKLAEVLKVKVKLLTTGETLYDGLMKDMSDSVTYKLASAKSTTDELYYEITAYLDTSVGNEYQNGDLIADFSWRAEGTNGSSGGSTGNLEPAPKTGDNSNMRLWSCLAAASGGVMVFLLLARRRREEGENG